MTTYSHDSPNLCILDRMRALIPASGMFKKDLVKQIRKTPLDDDPTARSHRTLRTCPQLASTLVGLVCHVSRSDCRRLPCLDCFGSLYTDRTQSETLVGQPPCLVSPRPSFPILSHLAQLPWQITTQAVTIAAKTRWKCEFLPSANNLPEHATVSYRSLGKPERNKNLCQTSCECMPLLLIQGKTPGQPSRARSQSTLSMC